MSKHRKISDRAARRRDSGKPARPVLATTTVFGGAGIVVAAPAVALLAGVRPSKRSAALALLASVVVQHCRGHDRIGRRYQPDRFGGGAECGSCLRKRPHIHNR